MDIPTFFTGKEGILNYDYSKITGYIGSSIDHSFDIDNLTPSTKKDTLLVGYFKSILLGHNHVFISKILEDLNNPSANICLPLLNQWLGEPSIDNLVIINHPDDAERIAKVHIKKAPIFKGFLYNSIISTTDNKEWKEQRSTMYTVVNGVILTRCSSIEDD